MDPKLNFINLINGTISKARHLTVHAESPQKTRPSPVRNVSCYQVSIAKPYLPIDDYL